LSRLRLEVPCQGQVQRAIARWRDAEVLTIPTRQFETLRTVRADTPEDSFAYGQVREDF
jgi:hypothetical protein